MYQTYLGGGECVCDLSSDTNIDNASNQSATYNSIDEQQELFKDTSEKKLNETSENLEKYTGFTDKFNFDNKEGDTSKNLFDSERNVIENKSYNNFSGLMEGLQTLYC